MDQEEGGGGGGDMVHWKGNMRDGGNLPPHKIHIKVSHEKCIQIE